MLKNGQVRQTHRNELFNMWNYHFYVEPPFKIVDLHIDSQVRAVKIFDSVFKTKEKLEDDDKDKDED